ncbi:Mediator of RNA polymerase II transcription subunit 27 [Armadillidium nasatum]|uniref:Mediator of RNA polymerase II transcription subunit 27 n=1 Tax=Armadillidium nasatum TaxID=96803 RepID=A0A5N5T7F1_9CRUS|nr:Mediator of RNA polymerase II transcription subunit 27 [Armadillidium nasatum]
MAELPNIENLYSTLKSLRVVRHCFSNFLDSLSEGSKCDKEDGNETANQKSLNNLRMHVRELEQNIHNLTSSSINPPGGPNVMSNIDVLSLDPSPDKLNLYHQLLDCYTWIDKVSSYSGMVHSICSGSYLKRSSMPAIRKRHVPIIYDANVVPQTVDIHIQNIKSRFPDMTLNVVRPLGSNAVLQVTLGRVLKAVVFFRGLLIEGVVVRAYNEPHTDEDGKVDLYRPSQYKVFQKVTDNANAAMLHFFTPGSVDITVRSFFTWLNSFSNLFTEVCKKCNYHVRHNYPPTWREFRTLQAFHEECRP